VVDYLTSNHGYQLIWFRTFENLVLFHGGSFRKEGKVLRIGLLVKALKDVLPNLELILKALLFNMALLIQIALKYPSETRGLVAKVDAQI
jgi:hypothetical protein